MSATNDMYRQLLNQAVSRNGSALIGGNSGGAMIGGLLYGKPKKKPFGLRSAENIAKGKQLQTPAMKAKREASNRFRTDYIDDKIRQAYGDRSKVSYDERLDIITQAKKELHKIKTDMLARKRENRTDAQKAEDKRKRDAYIARKAVEAGFTPSAEGIKAYRRAIVKPASEKAKAVQRAVSADPQVKAAQAAARARLRGQIGAPIYGVDPSSGLPFNVRYPREEKKE